jgi:hypothetical protein
MAEKDYNHRPMLAKLGIKPGGVVALAHSALRIDASLREQMLERTGQPLAGPDERADVVLVAVDRLTDIVAELERWKHHAQPAGGAWLLPPKCGSSGYVNQNELIEAGNVADPEGNKVCRSPTGSVVFGS